MKESFMVPRIVLIGSIIFYKVPPHNINGLYGYRTSTSRKSIEAWREGNKYSAKIFIWIHI